MMKRMKKGELSKEEDQYSAKESIFFWRIDVPLPRIDHRYSALHVATIPTERQDYEPIPEGWKNFRARSRLENRIREGLEVPLKTVPIEVNPTFTTNEFRRQIDGLIYKHSQQQPNQELLPLELTELLIRGWAIVDEKLYHQLYSYGVQKASE